MAHSNDNSLLDRLNALKPTSVNLDRSINALSIPTSGIEPAEPLSRDDALTERLRSLRNQREKLASDSGDPPPPYTASPSTNTQPPPSSSARATGPASPSYDTGRHRSGGCDEVTEGGSQSSGEYDDYFDDVLQPLDLDDDEGDGSGSDGDGGGGEGLSSKRVEDLLAKLKADPGAQPPLPAEGKPGASKAKDDDEDDDSEGEVMSREVENVISRAMDELKLDGPASQPAESDATDSTGGDPKADADGRAAASRDDDHELALPTVPQDAADNNKEHDASSPKPSQQRDSGDGDDDDTEAGLSLPAVPTNLVDPAPTSGQVPSGGDDPFESSIAARLAALKGASAPIIHTDALGLPSAPTFRPEDNRPERKLGRGPQGRGGYTDADQKTWCIVCLEDGTIRCLGCDDDSGVGDVYCARCWKEMHVGPSAGYDERGHAWEKFDPRRV